MTRPRSPNTRTGHRLAWIIHDSMPKTAEPFIQKGIWQFSVFDSVFLYTKAEIQSLEGLRFW